MTKTILMAALALSACSKQPEAEHASAPAVPKVNAAQVAYDRSVECFIYAGLNNMEEQGNGQFTGNDIIPILIDDATAKGALLGKDAGTVKAELLAAVKQGASETDAMSQPDKEAYVKKSVSEAITCLRVIRAQAAS